MALALALACGLALAFALPLEVALAVALPFALGLTLVLALTLVLGIGIALMIASIAGAGRFRMESDLAKVFNREVPALEVSRKIEQIFQLNYAPWISQVEDVATLQKVHAEMEQEEFIGRVTSLAPLFSENLHMLSPIFRRWPRLWPSAFTQTLWGHVVTK